MEIFVAYCQHIGAYPGHIGLPQTSKMESFTKIVSNQKPLTIVTKSSILGVAEVAALPLE